jgi:hypothetical protein
VFGLLIDGTAATSEQGAFRLGAGNHAPLTRCGRLADAAPSWMSARDACHAVRRCAVQVLSADTRCPWSKLADRRRPLASLRARPWGAAGPRRSRGLWPVHVGEDVCRDG